jgi:hypothetical protein
MDRDDDDNRKAAEEEVEKKFRKPLSGCAYPPRADVCFEGEYWLIFPPKCRPDTLNPSAALHTQDTGKHQDQVKALIEKTASSLDDTALKMLFVSVQQNNIELCVQYAIDFLTGQIGNYDTVCPCHLAPKGGCRLSSIQVKMVWLTMMWFGHSYIPVSINPELQCQWKLRGNKDFVNPIMIVPCEVQNLMYGSEL